MAKFKVGDKVRILNTSGISDSYLLGFETGGIYDVVEVDSSERITIITEKAGIRLDKQEQKYIEKVKNNQRIAALEKKIEELEDNSFHVLTRIKEIERLLDSLKQNGERIKAIEKRIEHLEQEMKQRLEVSNEPLTIVEDKPKTPNQQRREIIEKAKEFVNYLVTYIRGGYTRECKYGFIDMVVSRYCYTVDFQVGGKTIIATLALVKSPEQVMYCSVANCHPSGVFNEHIGKAIALGRALGLDVSEFEQAVQPTEAVVGMIVQNYSELYGGPSDYEINECYLLEYINEKLEHYRKGTFNAHGFNTRIINDTNAQYEGETI